MNSYKITNITNLAGKRDAKFNSVVDIEYIDKMTKKNIKLKAGDTVYLTVPSLPLSVHRLRIKNLITVSEVSAVEVAKAVSPINPPAPPKPKTVKKTVAVEEKNAVNKTIHDKKKSIKKHDGSENEDDA